MNILIIGAGAIGSYAAAALLQGGNEVAFLDRPEAAEWLRQNGLVVTSSTASSVYRQFTCHTSLESALNSGTYEAAILAVKSYDTPAVVDQIRPRQAEMPPVLCLQNGVENEALLAAVLGPGRVIAGTVTSSVSRPAGGGILVERERRIGIAAGHALSSRLAEALRAGGVRVRLYQDALAMNWSKMLTNLPANASAAILDLSPAQVFSNPRLFQMEMEMMREALLVMAALHLRPVDLPRVPVVALAFVTAWLPAGLARPILRKGLGAGRGGKMPSFHIDLHSGRGRSEVQWLNGAVARLGEQVKVRAPVNRLLTAVLTDLAEGRLQIEDYAGQPEKLLAQAGF